MFVTVQVSSMLASSSSSSSSSSLLLFYCVVVVACKRRTTGFLLHHQNPYHRYNHHRLYNSLVNENKQDDQEDKQQRSIGDVVQGLHGSKYQFSAASSTSYEGQLLHDQDIRPGITTAIHHRYLHHYKKNHCLIGLLNGRNNLLHHHHLHNTSMPKLINYRRLLRYKMMNVHGNHFIPLFC